MSALQLREHEIGRKLDETQRSGELSTTQSYGKPMLSDAGWEQTPDEFRMGFKILKNAGVVPPEVELFHQRAQLRAALEAASSEQRAASRIGWASGRHSASWSSGFHCGLKPCEPTAPSKAARPAPAEAF